MANNIFHWSLVRSWLFADAGRCLIGLFTLSSRLAQTVRGGQKELVQNYHHGKKSTIDILPTKSTFCPYEVLVGWSFAFGVII